ncbi:MAG TPA: TIGR02281 family clan AA aspartic protease [Brevundimonas sp.]|nr:TIGR02281 family clan AA aspartic protease [Brevundimonas sp.]
MRIDLSSAGVMAAAVASALTTLWWMDHAGLRGEAQAAPAPAAHAAQGVDAQVLKAADGHYWADALIDADDGGRAVRVMVDTGASVIALTPADAARLGLALKPSDYSASVVTAAGPAPAARVELASVSVAGARVERVEALVVQQGLPHSLLGMSYLGRLSAFTATPASLTLRP